MGRQPHVVVVPLPAQGHVKPLLQLSHRLVDHGIRVTFVNTEFIHAKITDGMSVKEIEESRITLASFPDGWETEKDRNDPIKFSETFKRVMSCQLISLIEEINNSSDKSVTCVIGDGTIGWILDVAKRFGIEGIAFMPMSAASLLLLFKIPKLIQAGIIDTNGTTIKDEEIMVSNDFPPWSSNELTWSFPVDMITQTALFELCVAMKEASEQSDWVICNTLYELEQSACDLIPNILPVGPLHGNFEEIHSTTTTGSFWQEDTSCLTWLSKQKPGSVIYISFGSFAAMSQPQFNQLALGLQHSRKPFLWIVREDIIYGNIAEYPDGFLEGVSDYGMIVKWAPQAKVLSHPSIACFLSHCGWNSTLEGLSVGLPFLCWPFFADQFHNRNYICDALRVGLKLNVDKSGSVSSVEISLKIEKVLSDGCIKENASKIKSLLHQRFSKEGSSFENMDKFVNHLKYKI